MTEPVELAGGVQLPITCQGLPPLKMSMHVYHRDVARRFVIIDGQRLNEGGVMGNETWAREIVPDGVIIEYKNIRFLLPRLGG